MILKNQCLCSVGLRAEGPEWLAEEGEGRPEQNDSGTESADDGYLLTPTLLTLGLRSPAKTFLLLFHPIRENGSFNSRRDSTAGDGPERGTLPLPEPPVGTPSPGGEIRRPEGGTFLG